MQQTKVIELYWSRSVATQSFNTMSFQEVKNTKNPQEYVEMDKNNIHP